MGYPSDILGILKPALGGYPGDTPRQAWGYTGVPKATGHPGVALGDPGEEPLGDLRSAGENERR